MARVFFATLFADLHEVKTRQLIITALKTGIAALSVYFIYRKVISRPDFSETIQQLEDALFRSENLWRIALLIFLLPLNWLLETAKWKLLLRKIEPVSWLHALRSVMTGVTVSFLTPNRVGEFAGRVMHLRSGYRIKAAIASVIGSMNQLLITVVAGGTGLLFSLHEFIDGNEPLRYVMLALIFVAIISLLFSYFRIRVLSTLSENFYFLRKLSLYTRIFEIYTSAELRKITMMSAMRYFVFTFQFWLALGVFGVDLPVEETFRLVSLIYLVMAVVPTIALSELTVRGSVALYFLAPVAGNSAGILAGSTLIWFVNLAVPALAGALAVFYFRFNK